MSDRCSQGCCPSQADHYRSLHVAQPGRAEKKVTTDDHGTHTVDVIERADRQDVVVHAPRVVVRATTTEQRD